MTATERRTRQGELTSVQIGKRHTPKVDRIAKKMGVNRSVVVRWAIEQFDLDSFLGKSSPNSTVDKVQPVETHQPV